MKHGSIVKLQSLIVSCLLVTVAYYAIAYNKEVSNTKIEMSNVLSKNYIDTVNINIDSSEPVLKNVQRVVVYKDMTIEELSAKLNKSLNSTLSNKGNIIAKYAIEYNVDPYMATAIILHETGCKWECSYLVKACNNVGGMKGSNNCGGGSYQGFSSLNNGIKSFMKNLRVNYYDYGLNTLEKIRPKYAGNNATWVKNVNRYIDEISSK